MTFLKIYGIVKNIESLILDLTLSLNLKIDFHIC